MMGRKFVVLAFVVTASFCSRADASLILDFSYDGGASFNSQTTANPGDSRTLSVFLRETGDTTILSTDGLAIFTIGFDYTTSEGTVGPVLIASPFANSSSGAMNGTGSLSGYSGDGVKSDAILLGTIEFTLDSNATGDTNFIFRDFDETSSIISGEPRSLDAIVFDDGRTFQTTITATAVPEPSSFALMGVAVAAVVARQRYRRGSGNRAAEAS